MEYLPNVLLNLQCVFSIFTFINVLMQCFSMRQDVFDVIVAFEKKGLDGLSAEEKRYVERMIKYGRRNGMKLRKTDTVVILSFQTDMSL